jgi:MoxR-like ATPase
MSFPYYTGNPLNRRADKPAQLPGSRRARQTDPAGYIPDTGLVDAVNVALLLGQPLLLTGEPGTGKTQLAYSLAWELGFDAPLIFETKSSSTSRDLFYGYDTLSRFHAAQTGEGSRESLDYITWLALGIAILQSRPLADVEQWLPKEFLHSGPRRSVVLIDEIDKAPRDFPNDLLNEVENLYFRVPELNNAHITASEEMRPILVLTSNSEKNLPDAFLRRCVYYNIPFPDRDRLADIVMARTGSFENSDSRLLSDALELFFRLREPASGLRKRPATAELIGWLIAMREMGAPADQSLRQHGAAALGTISTLIKSADDQETARKIVENWLK